jgi:beta-phosphoglucomutase-like phosphatase (HAD superfamily)
MTTTEKIAGLENRVEQLRLQMKRLLQVASTPAQKEAVTLGHQMTIDEFQERIDALKGGEPDPWE